MSQHVMVAMVGRWNTGNPHHWPNTKPPSKTERVGDHIAFHFSWTGCFTNGKKQNDCSLCFSGFQQPANLYSQAVPTSNAHRRLPGDWKPGPTKQCCLFTLRHKHFSDSRVNDYSHYGNTGPVLLDHSRLTQNPARPSSHWENVEEGVAPSSPVTGCCWGRGQHRTSCVASL